MNTKLTLRLSTHVIERAKLYAQQHSTSLSKMIEAYLDSITKEKKPGSGIPITPLVESLSGVINLDEVYDDKKAYRDYLEDKYE